MIPGSFRGLVLLLLSALCLAPDPVAAAATATPAPTTVQKSTTTKTTTTPAKRRRRTRRLPPDGVYSRHAVVIDPATDEVLFQKNAALSVPIASLTKLMTAIVLLEMEPDWDREVDVTAEDLRGGGRTKLLRAEVLTVGDLFHMSLMCSDNVATRVLARTSGLSNEEFISRMNRKALELGMKDSRFVEVTGLDERNVGTATDVAHLLRAATANERVRTISCTRTYEFRGTWRNRRRLHFVANTNRLLYGRYEIRGGKTGFISEAGYCLATWIRTGGRDLIAVVLGAPTNATRFADVVRLVQKTSKPVAATPATAP
jgi:D-alanyl-D-alanine endopeptidase (penicillin-binding protein 7)